jgi:hypothetical protein
MDNAIRRQFLQQLKAHRDATGKDHVEMHQYKLSLETGSRRIDEQIDGAYFDFCKI